MDSVCVALQLSLWALSVQDLKCSHVGHISEIEVSLSLTHRLSG
jgi:hypothetical protein